MAQQQSEIRYLTPPSVDVKKKKYLIHYILPFILQDIIIACYVFTLAYSIIYVNYILVFLYIVLLSCLFYNTFI